MCFVSCTALGVTPFLASMLMLACNFLQLAIICSIIIVLFREDTKVRT